MWLIFGGGWISSIRPPVRFLVFVSVCGKSMADIVHTILFVLVNIDWGDYWATINHMRYRFGFIR